MKNLLIGLLILGSISASYASQEIVCTGKQTKTQINLKFHFVGSHNYNYIFDDELIPTTFESIGYTIEQSLLTFSLSFRTMKRHENLSNESLLSLEIKQERVFEGNILAGIELSQGEKSGQLYLTNSRGIKTLRDEMNCVISEVL